MAWHLYGWHGVAYVGKRSVHCEREALEYLCGYERDTPKNVLYVFVQKLSMICSPRGEIPVLSVEHE